MMKLDRTIIFAASSALAAAAFAAIFFAWGMWVGGRDARLLTNAEARFERECVRGSGSGVKYLSAGDFDCWYGPRGRVDER